MNDLSVRGVYRRYLVEPRIAFFGTDDPTIVGDPRNISVANDIMISDSGSLRSYLEALAFTRHGGAKWHQNVCENIKGWVDYDQTWTHIDVRIQLVPDAGVTGPTLTSLQNTWQIGIEEIWNNPVHTLGDSPKPWMCALAGEVPCRVSFKVHWVTIKPGQIMSDAHHFVMVRLGSGETSEGEWYATDDGSVAAHEFGHMLGLADEYAKDNCPGRSPVTTGTVMDKNENFIPQRLVQWVADKIGSQLE